MIYFTRDVYDNLYFDNKPKIDRYDCICEDAQNVHRGEEYTQVTYVNNGTCFSGVFSNAKEVKEFEEEL